MYTIFAAVVRKATVYALEPESQNYAILNRNIAINGLSDRILAYCVAVADSTKISVLHVRDPHIQGGSLNSFDQAVDANLQSDTFRYRQGAVSTTIDALVGDKAIAPPTHIKIDVDGIEHLIIKGAHETLRSPGLRSVLIELNTHLQEHRDMIGIMSEMGFSYSAEQVEKSIRTDGPFRGTANHIFRR